VCHFVSSNTISPFKFLDNSSIATGKPTACHLLKSKKTIKKVDKNPTLSAAFWYSIWQHFDREDCSTSILDIIPCNSFIYFCSYFSVEPTILVAAMEFTMPYFVPKKSYKDKSKAFLKIFL
jgi:hypothetical protein